MIQFNLRTMWRLASTSQTRQNLQPPASHSNPRNVEPQEKAVRCWLSGAPLGEVPLAHSRTIVSKIDQDPQGGIAAPRVVISVFLQLHPERSFGEVRAFDGH